MAGALEQGRWRKRAGGGFCRFVAGKLEVATHKGSVLVAAADTAIRQDFTYSIRADVVSGPTELGFGLAFGMQDPDTYFLFAKRTDRDYRLTQRRGGQEHVILPWTGADAITDRRVPQVLQVVSEGPFVSLLVDGRRLQQLRLDRAPAGSVGLFVDAPGLTVMFSDVAFGPRN
jgi:hypothetical protein